MRLFVYNVESRQVVQIIDGSTNEQCESIAAHKYDTGTYAWTYVPVFGTVDGLKATRYKIEQKDSLGNWGEDFAWNQDGNEFDTEADALGALNFISMQYSDVPYEDFRVSEIE